MTERFTEAYVDAVIRMRIDKNEAKQFLRKNLRSMRRANEVTEDHYNEMLEYIASC